MPDTIHIFETAQDLLQRAALSTDKKPLQVVFDVFADMEQPGDARVYGFFARPASKENPDTAMDTPLSFILVATKPKENAVSVLQLAFLSGNREHFQGIQEGDKESIFPHNLQPRAAAQAIVNSMIDDNKMMGSHEDLVRRASELHCTEPLGFTVYLEKKAYDGQLRFFSTAAAEISALPQSPGRDRLASPSPAHPPLFELV